MVARTGSFVPADKWRTNVKVPDDQIADATILAQTKLRVAARKYTKDNPLHSDSPERTRIRQECEMKVGTPCDKANVPVKVYQKSSPGAKGEPDGPGSPVSIFTKDLYGEVDESALSDTE
jgi:hypothetical protein